MMDLINLVGHIFANPVKGMEGVQVANERGSLIHFIREMMMTSALQSEATHILWLDSDMRFPQDLFNRLWAHDEDIVCCNYGQRAVPVYSNTIGMDGKHVLTREDSTGLEPILSAGFGACLMKVDALQKLPRPYFDTMWSEREDGYTMVGEDVFFFRKARYHGLGVFVDHDVSKEVRHIGMFEYTNQMAVETQEERAAREEGRHIAIHG